jgi:hypothetical protein
MRIELHIDELVLDGLAISQQQGALVMDAVRQELGRLLADDAGPAHRLSATSVPVVAGTPIRSSEVASPMRLGAGIAASIAAGVGKAP